MERSLFGAGKGLSGEATIELPYERRVGVSQMKLEKGEPVQRPLSGGKVHGRLKDLNRVAGVEGK